MNLKHKRIILCKTNQIGDVTFALPLASAIKQAEPSSHIIFLGRQYTKALIEHYCDVDEFADWETIKSLPEAEAVAELKALKADIIIHVQADKQLAKLAKLANIPLRIGTSTRLYNWFYCNKRVKVSRKKSDLHESQLDMQYLKALGLKSDYRYEDIIALRHYRPFELTAAVKKYLDKDKFNLILHPKTRGEHIEWPAGHFAELIKLLPASQFHIMVTGSQVEGDKVRQAMIEPFPHVVDLCGKLSLTELESLIAHADGLIAASTGPVHLAANFGIHTLGLYAPIRPFHAGRWGPIGEKAQVLCVNKQCELCRDLSPCRCITEITPEQVKAVIDSWLPA